ncbi:MAG: helix-turn-helix domain-containing protein [Myxococcales bacterium]|nr:helix-turn-helix domain-containing protein [Myxococcales bacterium]
MKTTDTCLLLALLDLSPAARHVRVCDIARHARLPIGETLRLLRALQDRGWVDASKRRLTLRGLVLAVSLQARVRAGRRLAVAA